MICATRRFPGEKYREEERVCARVYICVISCFRCRACAQVTVHLGREIVEEIQNSTKIKFHSGKFMSNIIILYAQCGT